ncbi:hypothetical protein VRK_08610 [Vibrio sp. MEBiC08052]|nr:hypothetical protein VRK_08610 [Vibrio sp. MEBiC08052]
MNLLILHFYSGIGRYEVVLSWSVIDSATGRCDIVVDDTDG